MALNTRHPPRSQRSHARVSSRGQHVGTAARAPRAKSAAAPAKEPSSAREAVESGDQCFKNKEYETALSLYDKAMELKPDDDEARAARYNAACAHAKLKQWAAAVEDVEAAVNKYKLKIEVVLEDKDLAALRERREWLDVRDDLTGAVNRSTRQALSAEARAPFRLTRTAIAGGLGLGALLGLGIIGTKLIAIAGGAPDAPDLTETARNFAINLTAVVVLGLLVRRDLAAKAKDEAAVAREDELARLQIDLGKGRIVPIARLRGARRPLILAGSRGYINKCVRMAEARREELEERAFSLVPVVLSDADPEAKLRRLKREFGQSARGAEGRFDAKWKLKVHDTDEWASWLFLQQVERDLTAENFYILVQLDGSVRRSGMGEPVLQKLIDDVPPLSSIRTGFTDGVGPQVD